MERVYTAVDRVRKDTGRFDIIYQVRNADNYSEANLDNMIYMSDIADLIYALYDKGEGAYMQKLYWFTMDGEPSAVGWSGDATITMSDDGKSITIKSTGTHPDTGETFNSEGTYLRQ